MSIGHAGKCAGCVMLEQGAPSVSSQNRGGSLTEPIGFAVYAAILVGVVLVQPAWSHGAITLLFVALAAIFDWRFRRLPNGLTVPTMAAGVLHHALAAGRAVRAFHGKRPR